MSYALWDMISFVMKDLAWAEQATAMRVVVRASSKNKFTFMLEKISGKIYIVSNYIIIAPSGREVKFYGEEGKETKRKART